MSDTYGNTVNLNPQAALDQAGQPVGSSQNFVMGPGAVNPDVIKAQVEQELTQKWINERSSDWGKPSWSQTLNEAIDAESNMRISSITAQQTPQGNPPPPMPTQRMIPQSSSTIRPYMPYTPSGIPYNRQEIVVRDPMELSTPIWGEPTPMGDSGAPTAPTDDPDIIEGRWNRIPWLRNPWQNWTPKQRWSAGLITAQLANQFAGDAAAAYHPALAGEGYAQGQPVEQLATSALSVGIGATGAIFGAVASGAILGSAAGPLGTAVGAMAGLGIGLGIGGTAKGSIDTYYEGHEFAPERAAAIIGAGQGTNSKSELDAFVSALKDATNATKDFAGAAVAASQYGPVSPTGFGQLTGSVTSRIGSVAGPGDITSASKFLGSSPGLYNTFEAMVSGQGNYATLQDASMVALTRGDWSSAKATEAMAEAAGGDRRMGAALGPTFAIVQDERANEQLYSSGATLFHGQLSNIMARGASAEDVTRLAGQIAVQDSSAAASFTQRLGILQDRLRKSAGNPDERRMLTTEINGLYAEQQTYLTDAASATRGAFVNEVGQATSGFEATQAGARSSIAVGLLTGQSYQSMAGLVGTMVGAQRSEASKLTAYANDPHSPISPQERSEYRNRAAGITSDAATEAYQAKLGGYGQNLAEISSRQATAQANVTTTLAYGDPTTYAGAFNDAATAMKDRLAELASELKAGNLTIEDRTAKERELASVRAQLAVNPQQAAEATYSASGGIIGASGISAASIASVARMVGGSGPAFQAATDAQMAVYKQLYGLDTDASNNANLSPLDRAQAAAKAQQDILSQTEVSASKATYAPSVELGVAGIKAQGTLDRMALGFAEPGNRQDAIVHSMHVIQQQSAEFERQLANLRVSQNGELRPEQMEAAEAQRQQFKTQEAQAMYTSDTAYGKQLPGLTIGGGSFVGRLLASPAQAAWAHEHDGASGVALRQEGFYSSDTFKAVMDLPGASSLFQPGLTTAHRQPGNLTAGVLNGITTGGGTTPGDVAFGHGHVAALGHVDPATGLPAPAMPKTASVAHLLPWSSSGVGPDGKPWSMNVGVGHAPDTYLDKSGHLVSSHTGDPSAVAGTKQGVTPGGSDDAPLLKDIRDLLGSINKNMALAASNTGRITGAPAGPAATSVVINRTAGLGKAYGGM